MSDTITYQYARPSALTRNAEDNEFFLSKYSEVQKADAPCFFWGKLKDPYSTSRCLIALSNVVQSSFNLSPFERRLIKDPIVTAGNEKIRFEGFSQCAGVYARVDVLPDGHDGEFPANGTTNVDFNQPMISALSNIGKSENVVLSVGKKDVTLSKEGQKVVERKVPLPVKWIKGLTTVRSTRDAPGAPMRVTPPLSRNILLSTRRLSGATCSPHNTEPSRLTEKV